MKNKLIVVTIIAALVMSGVGFFAGTKYQQSKTPNFAGRLGQRQEGSVVMRGSNGEQINRLGASGYRPVSGTITSKDDTSMTVEIPDGGSKIILFSENTSFNKTEEGSKDDLTEGGQVTILGQENSDGSVTAQSVQIGGAPLRGLQ